jgi:hypothetical protein
LGCPVRQAGIKVASVREEHTMPATISILDPTAPAPSTGKRARRVLNGLKDKVVGFIDNTKPNFTDLVDDVAALLVSRHGVKSIVKRSKRAATVAAERAIIDELARECDLVIAGSGD